MNLGLKSVGDTYQHLLETMDDQDLDVLKEYLCNPGTRWMELDKSYEKTMLIMDLRPEPKIWYQLIKHLLIPISHNEIINKARLVLLHCITSFNIVNVENIIV